jgi:hypothetical protein
MVRIRTQIAIAMGPPRLCCALKPLARTICFLDYLQTDAALPHVEKSLSAEGTECALKSFGVGLLLGQPRTPRRGPYPGGSFLNWGAPP